MSRPGAIDGGVFIGRDETTGIGADAPPILATLDSLGVDRALALAPRAIWFDDEEGNRDLLAACRAGACPTFALSTFPMNSSCTSSGAQRARSSASRTASAPSAGADIDDSAPLRAPMGVRAAPQMNTSRPPPSMPASGC